MRNLVPFSNISRSMFDDMDDIFRGFSSAIQPMTRKYVPVDMYEENDEVVVSIDAPGIDPSNVELKTFSDRINIQSQAGETEEPKDEGKTWYMRKSSRSLNVCVTLPTEVDPDGAKATFKNGVITVKMPKSRAVQGKVLQIESE